MANESLVMTAEVRDSFSSTLRKLQSDLKSLSNTGAASTKTLQKDWKGVGSEIQSAAGSITRDMLPAMRLSSLAGFTLGGAIGGAALALKNFSSSTTSLSNFSKEIGLSGQELAKLKVQGEFFGQDWMNTQQGLRTFQDFMTRLKRDTGATISELRVTFGVAGDELARKLLNANSMKEARDIAFEAIKATGSESQARKIAQSIFGNESWARIIRETTPELEVEFKRIVSKIEENKEAAQRFDIALLGLKVTTQNLANEGLGPLLKVSSDLIEKWKEPIGGAIKDFAKDVQALADQFERIGAFFTAPSWEGFLRLMDTRRGTAAEVKPPTTADTNRKLDNWLGPQSGGGAAPGSPAKDIPKTNEELRQTNEKLKTATEKQTSAFDKFIAIIGQGGDTAGLGPGLGGVSAGAGGLGALAPFRAAMGGGAGGPSIRRGTGGGAMDPGGTGHVGSWWNPERRQFAIDYLKKNAGLSEVGAQGLVARWAGVEAAQGPGSVNPSSGAVGIAQWLGTRKAGTPGDFEGQLAKAARELNTTEGRAAGMLRGAKTPLEAAVGAAAFERAEGYNPATGADSHVGKTLATMRAMSRGADAAPADLKDLRIKSGATGGGNAEAGVVDIARYAQSNVEGFNRVTAMNDRFHQFRRRSAHNRGLATDFTVDDPKQAEAAAQKLRDRLSATGLDAGDYKVINEYARPSSGATGGHLHVQFNTPEAADRYRKATLLEQQGKAERAKESKLEANGTVNVHLHDGLREKNAKVDTDGMFKDVKVNRGRPMSTAEDYSPLGRAAAGF